MKITKAMYREAATRIYGSDDIEIDDKAEVSRVENRFTPGAWVRAWIWVTDEEVANV